ncbi:MAG TPA: ACT domain-containing protein [Desulfomonilaceae bacterium]|nr:ACT domain-containing protein [Desulfomonilaceae bacterium]
MNGETDLGRLLASMDPELANEEYVFISSKSGVAMVDEHSLWAMIREAEGVTYILEKDSARRSGYVSENVFRRITLRVHSSLEAVGFTAAISAELSRHGLSANFVSGFYHDHLFLPTHRAEEALEVLRTFSKQHQ